MKDLYLGVDVGGTKTEICVLSLSDPDNFSSYEIVARERMSTERSSLDAYLSQLKRLINDTLKAVQLKPDDFKGVGLGLPGAIDPVRQMMDQGSMPFFKGIPLIPAFQKALGFNCPFVFDNDANCFALAEAYMGAGATWAKQNSVPLNQLCMIGVTLGTGVGGGIVINGQLVRGKRGGAAEIGHTTLIEAGRPCYCGKLGCAEQYLSGKAFEHAYSTRASALEHLSGPEIFARIEAKDPLALGTLERYRDHLVTFLSNLSNVLDPHVIVLGGGMSSQSLIYEGITKRLSEACFLTESPPAVIPNQQGGSAGVVGAALLSYAHRSKR